MVIGLFIDIVKEVDPIKFQTFRPLGVSTLKCFGPNQKLTVAVFYISVCFSPILCNTFVPVVSVPWSCAKKK